jgi:hypothetical protein
MEQPLNRPLPYPKMVRDLDAAAVVSAVGDAGWVAIGNCPSI